MGLCMQCKMAWYSAPETPTIYQIVSLQNVVVVGPNLLRFCRSRHSSSFFSQKPLATDAASTSPGVRKKQTLLCSKARLQESAFWLLSISALLILIFMGFTSYSTKCQAIVQEIRGGPTSKYHTAYQFVKPTSVQGSGLKHSSVVYYEGGRCYIA